MLPYATTLLLAPFLGCSADFTDKTSDPTVDDSSTDTAPPIDTAPGDSAPVDSGDRMDCASPPGAGSVPTDPTCTFVPSASGNPFSVRVEWSMAHAMVDPSDSSVTHPAYAFEFEPSKASVFQAPAVAQATDDNSDGVVDEADRPDVAVVMGNEYESDDPWSVLRLISGDGARVHDSVSWLDFEGDRYAPFVMSGVAVADTDLDGNIEVAVMVIAESDDTCHPALYEVGLDGSLSLSEVGSTEIWCLEADNGVAGAHAPALADIDLDGTTEIIFGRQVFDGTDLSLRWAGTAGRGNYNTWNVGSSGYWNSGYHSFAYDLDGDGAAMEVVAGRTVYTSTGGTYCQLGRYDGSTWVPADDGYPAVADLLRFSGDRLGEPEIVLTGNQYVSIYRGVPASGKCVEVGRIANDPYATSVSTRLPAHPDCDRSRKSFGGPPTIADFAGDGSRMIGVAGSCWFSIFQPTTSGPDLYAIAQTRDWSSASTGATVFDFNGDGTDEVVFSDEEALTVWQVDATGGLQPWDRLETVLRDTNHGSWTIHEYPIVADVDGDGKAEILVSNEPWPGGEDRYGLYLLGAADDDWVTARPLWNQHAYYVTNVEDDGTVGYGTPNYAPYTSGNLNSFRLQAPGKFGATAAPNLILETTACQTNCGDGVEIWVQVGNTGAYITASAGLPVTLYGINGSSRTLLATQNLPADLPPGTLTPALIFEVADWSSYDRLEAVVDDPAAGAGSTRWGTAKECEENDNDASIDLSGFCP